MLSVTYKPILLCVIMLNAVMLSVIMLNVLTLSVMAPTIKSIIPNEVMLSLC